MELARNFPFLTQPSIAQYFKKEKSHFYHTLMGIEKLFKLPALQFAPAKVLNVASAVSGTDSERSPTPPHSASSPPTTAAIEVACRAAADAIALPRLVTNLIASSSLSTPETAAAVISPTECPAAAKREEPGKDGELNNTAAEAIPAETISG
jgi:hypothetical protein